MREETIIQAVNDIDTIARLTEDLHQQHFINEPDYWEKLHHQAAISAMQGMLSNSAYMENFVKYAVEGESLVSVTTQNAFDYATALVEKLKNEK